VTKYIPEPTHSHHNDVVNLVKVPRDRELALAEIIVSMQVLPQTNRQVKVLRWARCVVINHASIGNGPGCSNAALGVSDGGWFAAVLGDSVVLGRDGNNEVAVFVGGSAGAGVVVLVEVGSFSVVAGWG